MSAAASSTSAAISGTSAAAEDNIADVSAEVAPYLEALEVIAEGYKADLAAAIAPHLATIQSAADRAVQAAKVETVMALVRDVQAYAAEHDDALLKGLLRAAASAIEKDPTDAGSIELIVGPMFSEKTTEMLSRVRRAALAGEPAVVVKWAGDTRYEAGAVVAAHSEVRQPSVPGSDACAPIRVVVARRLAAAELDEDELVVGVDEGQFYPDLVEQCEAWAREGRRVIVAALDGDFARRPFGAVCDLVPRCESVEKLRGVCMSCRKRDSVFSQRLSDSTAVVQEGGRESYRSVCRPCYFGKK